MLVFAKHTQPKRIMKVVGVAIMSKLYMLQKPSDSKQTYIIHILLPSFTFPF